jgi:hypothetical protein
MLLVLVVVSSIGRQKAATDVTGPVCPLYILTVLPVYPGHATHYYQQYHGIFGLVTIKLTLRAA